MIFVYLLLCVLTVLFTRAFFWETLYAGAVPDRLSLVVFFAIPVALLVFMCFAGAGLVRDAIAQRPGTKFRLRLLAYFVVTVIFSAAPLTIVTGISISELVRFWHSFDAKEARDAARLFAVESFSFHIERFEGIVLRTDWNALLPRPEAREENAIALPDGIASAQDFVFEDGAWRGLAFFGDEGARLALPPAQLPGITIREMPRDAGFIRYVLMADPARIRLVSYALDPRFDSGMAAIELQATRFDIVGVLRDNLRILEFFYYFVFFVPPLLMTIIMAISFAGRVTAPIAELTQATRRVAAGDFSVQIVSNRQDDLGILARSFNAMVQDIETSRAALIKAEKVSIWQNMAQQLAHEIKNPLTPIKLSAERVLRRHRNDPDRVSEIVEDSMMAIIQETEGLTTLLNEFRAFSRPIEPSVSAIRLGEALPEIVASYQASYPDVSFDVEHASNDIAVKIGKNYFSRILANIMLNAIHAMDESGSIEIRTDLVKKKGAQFCRLSVKDSGRGIPEEEAEKVFTPYFTTKEAGTGLGLPIIERIINDHGGSIWFDSAQGIGTVFFIDLPADMEEAAG